MDCDSGLNSSPVLTLWSVHELNVFARKTTGDLAGMDSLHKHVEQISFRQCLTFCKHCQLKRWQPHFQPKEAKSFLCSSHRGAISILQQFLETTTPWPNPLLLCMRRIFFLQLQRRDGRDTSTMQNWWSILRLSGTSSFWQAVEA